MTQRHTRLFVTPLSAAARNAVTRAAVGWPLEAYPGALGLPADGAVLVLMPDETLALRQSPGDCLDRCAVILWSESDLPLQPALLDDARVVAVVGPTSTDAALYTALRTAAAHVERASGRTARMLERVLEVGRALAAEKDLDTLLGQILTHARALTDADGASIYTRDTDGLFYFRLWQNATTGDAPGIQKTAVSESSIAGYVARSGETLALDDAYAIPPGAPCQFNPDYDRKSGYRTRSLLTVPLTNKANEVVGVLQLINRKDRPEVPLRTPADVETHVRPFGEHDRLVAAALAGQAGVALENSMLYADIERLFEGFIRASVQAIEARDPTTAGHSERVADFTERLAVAVDRTDSPGLREVSFSKDELRELRYASLLHDFGKVGVREYVLVKAKKLQPHQLDLVKQRFRYARASLERRAYRTLLALHDRQLAPDRFAAERAAIERQLAAERGQLDRYLQVVLTANEPSVLPGDVSSELKALTGFLFPGEEGETLPLLHDFEFADLSLPKGSLNSEEREEIESHVTHTYAFLSLIPWTKNLANLPNIAYAHHEKLDGTGYPRKLPLPQIPVQSRMMTISDIYDALTAADRPYKRSLPAEKALDILGAEAKSGKIDEVLYRVFVESRAWAPVSAR
jgi:HD-GYP domain-containing protein (c-di-GMP phosphodiesterase class II)